MKHPSFVLDWLQLQINFDSFRNRLRARYLFRNKNSNHTLNVEGSPAKKTPKMKICKNKLSRIGNITGIS